MGNINNNKEKEKEDKNEISIENENNNVNNNLNHVNNIIYYDPFSTDNIIRKIKLKFWNYFVFDIIEKNLINKNIRFKKFSPHFLRNFKKKYNKRILKMKISDILYEQEISFGFNHNNR